MTTVQDMLRDADPIRYESRPSGAARERARRTVVAAAPDAASPRARSPRPALALAAVAALIVIGAAAVASQVWSRGTAQLYAAVRFEVHLAETSPGAGLEEVRIPGSDKTIYLHPEVIANNDDIAHATITSRSDDSRFDIGVEYNAAGAERMRLATKDHIGRPIAFVIDGNVVMAPVLRGLIETASVVTGDYTREQAERIMNGISRR